MKIIRLAGAPTPIPPDWATKIALFLDSVGNWQRNTYGQEGLLESYANLPPEIQKLISAPLRGLYRGDGGYSYGDPTSKAEVVSFTKSRSYAEAIASIQRGIVLDTSNIVSARAAIDTDKVRRLADKYHKAIAAAAEPLYKQNLITDTEVGDDEGEVILLDAVLRHESYDRP